MPGGGKRGRVGDATIPTFMMKATTSSGIPQVQQAFAIEKFDIPEWLATLSVQELGKLGDSLEKTYAGQRLDTSIINILAFVSHYKNLEDGLMKINKNPKHTPKQF